MKPAPATEDSATSKTQAYTFSRNRLQSGFLRSTVFVCLELVPLCHDNEAACARARARNRMRLRARVKADMVIVFIDDITALTQPPYTII